MTKADALIIVTPEYNHGYPGELKLVLDQLYDEYRRKPVAFCGLSISLLGGGRAIEQLRLVAVELQMVPIRNAVYFPNVDKLLEEEEEKLREKYHARLENLFEELIWYANVLKHGRESADVE